MNARPRAFTKNEPARSLRARPREEDDAEEEAKDEPTDEEQTIKHRSHEAPLVLTFVQLFQFRSVDGVVVSHAEKTRQQYGGVAQSDRCAHVAVLVALADVDDETGAHRCQC